MNVRFPPNMLVGTSSWSSRDWCGSFYPESVDPGEMIRLYAGQLPTVEIDSTWYRIPDLKMIKSWKSRTPKGFVFSAKVPKVITHDKYLEDCETELKGFLSVMSGLDDKLGPLLLQFPYMAKGRDPQEYETSWFSPVVFPRRIKKLNAEYTGNMPAGRNHEASFLLDVVCCCRHHSLFGRLWRDRTLF